MTPISRERIYDVVRRIPKGCVATYGQIAALAGLRGHARQIGYAMAALPSDSDVPWHRVINSKGCCSPRATPGGDVRQRQLLQRERIRFDDQGRVSLEKYRWRPVAGFDD